MFLHNMQINNDDRFILLHAITFSTLREDAPRQYFLIISMWNPSILFRRNDWSKFLSFPFCLHVVFFLRKEGWKSRVYTLSFMHTRHHNSFEGKHMSFSVEFFLYVKIIQWAWIDIYNIISNVRRYGVNMIKLSNWALH